MMIVKASERPNLSEICLDYHDSTRMLGPRARFHAHRSDWICSWEYYGSGPISSSRRSIASNGLFWDIQFPNWNYAHSDCHESTEYSAICVLGSPCKLYVWIILHQQSCIFHSKIRWTTNDDWIHRSMYRNFRCDIHLEISEKRREMTHRLESLGSLWLV